MNINEAYRVYYETTVRPEDAFLDVPTVPDHTENYQERVDLITDVLTGILGMLIVHPMISALAGPEFVAELANVTERLQVLRDEVR